MNTEGNERKEERINRKRKGRIRPEQKDEVCRLLHRTQSFCDSQVAQDRTI